MVVSHVAKKGDAPNYVYSTNRRKEKYNFHAYKSSMVPFPDCTIFVLYLPAFKLQLFHRYGGQSFNFSS